MESMIWAQLIQLSNGMWGRESWRHDDPKGWRASFRTQVFVDEDVWKRVMEHIAKSGVNTVLIDVGDAVVFPSHPELAVDGSWKAEKLAAEVKRIRAMGLEVVPKLNFAATHDQWLKEYGRMVGTQKYYEVCRDVIRDTCEIFDKPSLFHIGLDEELMDQIRAVKDEIGTYRRGKAWWKDVRFYAECCEKLGARPWMFADYAGDFPDEFISECPKSILQSAWYYRDLYGNEPKVKGEKNYNGFWLRHIRTFDTLAKGGFEQIPCGSTWDNECICKGTNIFKGLVDYCDSIIDRKMIKGYLQTIWKRLQPGVGGEYMYIRGADHLTEAKVTRKNA